MRVNHLLMLLAISLVGLSGCLGFGDDGGDAEDDCPADDHDHDEGNGTAEANHEHDCPAQDNDDEDPLGNVTDDNVTEVPNELPVANLNMTDGEGNVLDNTSFVMVGGNITFSAEGSADPDGSIDLVGLTVKDSNGTRTAQLYQDGAFVPVTFAFSHEGAVNVTLRVLDDRGEATVIETATFVNRVQTPSVDITGAGGSSGGDASDCDAPTYIGQGGTISGDITGKGAGFQVAAGAQWIEATLTGGSGEIAICDPEGNAISGASGDRVVTNEGVTLEPSINYYVMVLSGSTPNQTYTLDVVVHHEPRPAEP